MAEKKKTVETAPPAESIDTQNAQGGASAQTQPPTDSTNEQNVVPTPPAGGRVLDPQEVGFSISPIVADMRPVVYLVGHGDGVAITDLSVALWEKFCPDARIELVSAEDHLTALLDYIANDAAPAKAVFVPVLTVPVSPVSVGDLTVLKSFALNDSRRMEIEAVGKACRRMFPVPAYIPAELPMMYDKVELAEMIAKLQLSDRSVNIATLYASIVRRGEVAYDASVSGSNITGLVARINPNMSIVEGYLSNRKFVVTSIDGFVAIEHLLRPLAMK